MFEWKESNAIAPRLWEYIEIQSEGHDYTLNVRRMDDEYTNRYKSNATGFKYRWSLETDETFYVTDCEGTILTDGYTMTREEAEKAAIKAYNEREKWRKEWQEW